MTTPTPERRLLSKDGSIHTTDEFFNTLTATIGAILSLFGAMYLVYNAQAAGDFWRVVSFSIYGFGVIGMFTTSALHHGVDGTPETNHLLRQLDYYAIFIIIAGSFTPFCLLALKNTLGHTVLALVWILAVVGIFLKACFPHIPKWIILSFYIGMGWLGILIAKPIYQVIHEQGLFALLLGGFFFTVGGIIFGLEKPNPVPGKFGFHEIWHCFVFAGVASHFYIMAFCL